MSGYSRGTNFAFSCILNLPGGRHCVLFTSLCSVSHIAPDTHWVSTNVVRLQNRELPHIVPDTQWVYTNVVRLQNRELPYISPDTY